MYGFPLEKQRFSEKQHCDIFSKNHQFQAPLLDLFGIIFWTFSVLFFAWFFDLVFNRFYTKNGSQNRPKSIRRSHLFGIENRYFSAGLLFGGSLVVLAPFLVHFGRLWAPFCFNLDHFGIHFRSVCTLLAPTLLQNHLFWSLDGGRASFLNRSRDFL